MVEVERPPWPPQAVNYIDRFLSLQEVKRSQLQLVGVTCMWVAAKYEEIHPPKVAVFSYITANTYPKEEILQMEEMVLKKLNYELTVPTAKTFLQRLLQVSWQGPSVSSHGAASPVAGRRAPCPALRRQPISK